MKEQNNIKVCQISSVPLAIYFLLLNQLKSLKNSGYNVSVVCSPGKWITEIEKQDFLVKQIKMTRKISPLNDIMSLIKIFLYFRKEKFDIVHTSTPKAGFLGAIAAKIAGVPIIIHSNLGFYFHNDMPPLKRKFYFLMEKIVAMCADLVLSVDQEDIKTAIDEGLCSTDKIKYLGGWVDLDRFNPLKFSNEFIENKKKEIGIPLNKKIIGIVARLVKEKGFLDLFKALSIIIKKNPNVLLVVVGPEELEKSDKINPKDVVNYGIENNVIFLGERTDVAEIFSVLDVFVLPSYREGIGISVLESSAMGKPVVATNIRGCREAVDNGKTGILVPVKSPQKLAEAINFFLENPQKAKEFGINGRKKIEQEYDEKLAFKIIHDEYQRLIKKKLK